MEMIGGDRATTFDTTRNIGSDAQLEKAISCILASIKTQLIDYHSNSNSKGNVNLHVPCYSTENECGHTFPYCFRNPMQ